MESRRSPSPVLPAFGFVRKVRALSSRVSSITILSGAAGVYVFGKVGRRLFTSSVVPLFAALAYGLSVTMIEIFCDVRGYALALLFTLAAFWCFIRFLQAPQGRKAGRFLLGWSVLGSLGILTEYYVLFFILACFGILWFHVLRFPQHHGQSIRFIREMPSAVAQPLILLCCTVGWLYF